MKNDKKKNEDQDGKRPIEVAAERLAEVLIAQIEFQKNEDKK